MRETKTVLKFVATALAAAGLLAACSKKAEQTPGNPPAEVKKPVASEPAPAPVAGAKPSVPATVVTAKPQPVPAPATQLAGSAAQFAAQQEAAYAANADFAARVEAIYKLSDAATPEAITALGRLFHAEKDAELKTEILDSLFDIEGQDDKKAALLAAGAGSDQPKEVRESAIDGLQDIGAKQSLPILKALVSDPDPEVQQAAKDAIEALQDEEAQPLQPK